MSVTLHVFRYLFVANFVVSLWAISIFFFVWITLVNIYVDLVVFTHIAGTSQT